MQTDGHLKKKQDQNPSDIMEDDSIEANCYMYNVTVGSGETGWMYAPQIIIVDPPQSYVFQKTIFGPKQLSKKIGRLVDC